MVTRRVSHVIVAKANTPHAASAKNTYILRMEYPNQHVFIGLQHQHTSFLAPKNQGQAFKTESHVYTLLRLCLV